MPAVGAQPTGADLSLHVPPFSPALQALLACVGADDASCASALQAAAQAGADLTHEALMHGLVPRLYQRVRQAQLEGALPPAQWEALRTAYLRRARRQAALVEMAAEVRGLLQEAGILSLPLKGLALAGLRRQDQLPRDMVDVDLWVPAEAIVRAAALLQASGYRQEQTHWTPTPWEYHLPHLLKGPLSLELHWRMWPRGPLLPFDLPDGRALSDHGVTGRLSGADVTVPDAASQLLIGAAGLAVDGLAVQLRHWADLYWLWEQLTEEDERRLAEMAAAARMTRYLRVVRTLLAELWPAALTPPTGPELVEGQPPLPKGEGEFEVIRRIAWRRLVCMPRAARRVSTMLLFWRRLHGAGDQMDGDWRRKLPPELQGAAVAQLWAQTGGAFVAGGKLLRRSVLWLADSRERLALREELALAEALWGLAE